MKKLIELKPQKDSRKSFYGKAFVEDNTDIKRGYHLYSYNTLVCIIFNKCYMLNWNLKESELFSHTTLRHIKEFLYQYGKVEIKNKKELMKNEIDLQLDVNV
jgi:hypothetical protein